MFAKAVGTMIALASWCSFQAPPDYPIFMKLEDAKASALATGKPILIMDATKEAGPRAVIDRLYGKRSACQLRAALVKGLKVADKSRASAR